MVAISSGDIPFNASITSSFLSFGFLNSSEKVDEGVVGFLRVEVAHVTLGGSKVAVGQQLFYDTAVSPVSSATLANECRGNVKRHILLISVFSAIFFRYLLMSAFWRRQRHRASCAYPA